MHICYGPWELRRGIPALQPLSRSTLAVFIDIMWRQFRVCAAEHKLAHAGITGIQRFQTKTRFEIAGNWVTCQERFMRLNHATGSAWVTDLLTMYGKGGSPAALQCAISSFAQGLELKVLMLSVMNKLIACDAFHLPTLEQGYHAHAVDCAMLHGILQEREASIST